MARKTDDLAGELRAGQRVRVPFRSQSRRSHGYVFGFARLPGYAHLREVGLYAMTMASLRWPARPWSLYLGM